MKLTWFGGTTLRVHIGGRILVVDADGAPSGISHAELTGGADRLLQLYSGLDRVEQNWRPRTVGRLLDEESPPLQCWSLATGTVVIDAVGEPPLLLLGGDLPALGRWADRAVVVVLGEAGPDRALALSEATQPRLIALALPEPELDLAFAELPPRLDGTGLVALERGLAVEV